MWDFRERKFNVIKTWRGANHDRQCQIYIYIRKGSFYYTKAMIYYNETIPKNYGE